MNDRNAAIKALERAWNYLDVQMRTFKAVVLKCNGVYDGVTVFDETLDGIKDAIELLKAHEPVEPVPGYWDRDMPLFNCGACGGEIGAEGVAKYCLHCGMAVRWK